MTTAYSGGQLSKQAYKLSHLLIPTKTIIINYWQTIIKPPTIYFFHKLLTYLLSIPPCYSNLVTLNFHQFPVSLIEATLEKLVPLHRFYGSITSDQISNNIQMAIPKVIESLHGPAFIIAKLLTLCFCPSIFNLILWFHWKQNT